MSPQRRLVIAAAVSFIAGGLVTGALCYGGFSRHLRDVYAWSFYSNAAEAQFEVRSLARLRAGDTDKVIKDLELLLNGHTMQLAEYETAVEQARRDPYVYRTLAEVREYRERFPAHFDYPLQQAEFQKALDLGKKAGG
jgi:hypothetical protein